MKYIRGLFALTLFIIVIFVGFKSSPLVKVGYSIAPDSGVLTHTELHSEKTFYKVENQVELKEEEIEIEIEIDDSDINIVVFGLDEGNLRTDVIFVVNLNPSSGQVSITSIPRDTKVIWDETLKRKISANSSSSNIQRRGWVSKVNEMPVYAHRKGSKLEDNIREFSIYQIEKILDIKIESFVLVDLSSFKKIVDSIGGVTLEVPRAMRYTDRSQGLNISLKEGIQTLNGSQAEQLVRFRKGYAEGDVGRIRTQQLFLTAFLEKVTSLEVITKWPELTKIVLESVRTDISITEIPKYLRYLKGFNKEELTFEILPGKGRYENGISYYFPD